MVSSLHKGYIAHSATPFGNYYPVSSAVYHDTLDSALHLHDEYAQVRVNWPARAAGVYFSAGGTTVGTWYPIVAFACPMSMRGDGTSFRLRVRVTASMSAANSGAFRAVLSSPDRAGYYANRGTAAGNTSEASTSSTTAVVLSPASNIVYMDIDMAREAIGDMRGYDAVSGATPVDITICDAALTIWAKTTNAAATPRVFGVYAAEYIGL